MAEFKELFQTADWKTEKHVPVIAIPEEIRRGEAIKIAVTVGKEIAHPNTTEHHIEWIEVYFLAEGEKLPYQIGRFEFSAHGASVQGPNTSTVYTPADVICYLKTEKSGMLFATSYCNIHGIWQNAQRVSIK
jgi:superoxide reductase